VSAADPLEKLLATRRILVCVGTGGVGKTTLAAALSLEGARRGRRTVVLTIDPARRLADALGVAELGNEPTPIDATPLAELGLEATENLWALMLDMRRTFDDLVFRFAENPETRSRILRNRIYQHVSDALAGSAEYAAMEKVFELSERDDFDLIVVDTPPSQHALDFLAAPRRLVEFLDSRIVQLLVHPAFVAGRMGFRIFQRGTARILRLIERVSGVAFLEEISEFLLAFEGMAEGFRERAHRVQARLLGPDAAFVIAAAPAEESVGHALQLFDRLEGADVRPAGVIVNRVRLWPGGGTAPEGVPEPQQEEAALNALSHELAAREGESFPAEAAARAALSAADGYASWVRADGQATARLEARALRWGAFVRRVPELRGDVHDLAGLAQVASWLFPRPSKEGS
jgi:anion-transporting  ArsA/GET3 family ATPase